MIKAISKRMRFPVILCGVLGALVWGVFAVFKNGILISSLQLGKLHINKFYLKLDNKLVLQIGRLDLSEALKKDPKKTPPSLNTIIQGVRYSLWVLSYFQELSVQEIIFNPKTKAHVLFDGKTYELDFPGIQAKFLLQDQKNLSLKLLQATSTLFHARAQGQAYYNPHTKQLSFDFDFSPLNDVANLRKSQLVAHAQGLTDFNTLALKLSTNEIHHLDFLKPYFPDGSHPVVQAWLFDNIVFSGVRVSSAKAILNLKDKNMAKTLLDRIGVQAIVKNAYVRFHNKLSPIYAKEVALELKDRALIIEPKNVIYETMPLDNSRVQINHLGKGSSLSADIRVAPSLSFQSTKRILQAYDISLPIAKLNAPLNANLLLGVQFLPHGHSLFSIQGSIDVSAGSFLLYDTPFYAQQAHINLDITPERKYVSISTSHTRYHNMVDVDADLMLDFVTKQLKGNFGVHKIQINTNNAINMQPFSPSRTLPKTLPAPINAAHLPNIVAQGKQVLEKHILASIKAQNREVFSKDVIYANATNLPSLEFSLNFSKSQELAFSLGNLGVEGRLKNGIYSLDAKDLHKLFGISPILRYYGIKKGTLHVSSPDFKNVKFVGIIHQPFPLYRHDGRRINSISFLGTFKPEGVEIFSDDGAIMGRIQGKQQIFFFNDINFNIDEFLQAKIPFIKDMLAPDSTRPTKAQIRDESAFIRAKQHYEKLHNIQPISTIISASNTTLRLKSFPLALNNIRLVVRDGRTMIDGNYHHAMLSADIVHGDVIVRARNFSGDYLNLAIQSVTSQNLIGGGLYGLTGVYRNRVFNGELRLQNTIIKNFKVLQNIVNIINTIPSLIVFRDPRLGVHGYEISKGRVLFGVSSDYLGLEHIQLSGTTLDIDGNGIIELSNKKTDLSLDISTIKGFSNVINRIPIINYLILGGSGKISTHVHVSKTLDNPAVKVTLAKDIAQAPFKILRRIFTPIDIIVDEIKKGLANHDSARLPERSSLHNP
ncbi:YhdP family protein [Helicobacter cynogastricus]|uniref:YhdP family protein n=1 Tax=Helicobacter cynogastricus TaxID=329937 RepID=UPI001F46B586|nr:AsmA-like C-terminal domain-containing protein [Helicobacter cynogastricus]